MNFRQADKLLRKNGWKLTRINGSHHQYRHEGIGYCVTVPNHGHKELSPVVLKNLREGTGLSF